MLSTAPPAPAPTEAHLRPARPEDADAVARIVYEAFGTIHDRHRFPRDFPTLEAAAQLTSAFIAHESIWGVVAEHDGRIVGSNFVDERGSIRGVGPITVAPGAQARGLGRRLMQAVIERSAGAPGVRLLQDSFNTASLALYASLGFRVTDPVVVVGGRPSAKVPPDVEVRALTRDDVPACEALACTVLGFERTAELLDAIETLTPVVAVRGGRVVAYATTLTFFPAAHAVAESQEDMWALIAGALARGGDAASFLVPTRQAELFRACLDAGLRVVKPMTYMVIGEDPPARGAWLPSVLC